MSCIISTSFRTRLFPNALKRAIVSPVHKTKSKKAMSDYWRLSVLSAFSKIFEKAFHHRINRYQSEHDLLNRMQFGFRPSYSTEHALLAFLKEFIDSLESKKNFLAVSIYLSKPFYTLDHIILLRKLKKLGINGPPLDWIQSYLQNHSQFTKLIKPSLNHWTLDVVCHRAQYWLHSFSYLT